jgi:putative glycosyltransferase (TIGR04372 family)
LSGFIARTLGTALLLILKLLRPLLRVRVFVVGFHRFGHLALEPEVFLSHSTKDLNTRTFDLWSLGKRDRQSNSYLAAKWAEVIRVCPSWLVGSLLRAGKQFPRLALENPKLSIHGPDNALDKSTPHLKFTDEEHQRGREQLLKMGIDAEKPIVCLIVRDSSHYLSRGEKESAGYSFLNFDISSFKETAHALADLGYQIVRMGAGTETPFEVDAPGIFDYAKSEHRSEFLDVYIAGTCTFAISTQTGPDAVCLAFRRPVYYVDVTRFSQFFFGTQIAFWNPAQIYLKGSRLSLKQILDSPIFWLKDPDDFLRHGVEVVRSTPNELAEMSIAFAKLVSDDFVGTNEWNAQNEKAFSILDLGMGERGRLTFGLTTSPLNPLFAKRHAEWFLE